MQVRVVTSSLLPQRVSMTTSLRRKINTALLQSGLEAQIKKRRVFGSGWTAALSEITDSHFGHTISRAMAIFNIVSSSGRQNGTTMFVPSRTTLSVVRGCAPDNNSDGSKPFHHAQKLTIAMVYCAKGYN